VIEIDDETEKIDRSRKIETHRGVELPKVTPYSSSFAAGTLEVEQSPYFRGLLSGSFR
jgi:hypothetical protein